jgi:hypothetical protein
MLGSFRSGWGGINSTVLQIWAWGFDLLAQHHSIANLNPNPLYLIERDLIARPVIELRCPR